MILKMYTIRDTKTEFYNTPWFKKTHGEAERDFRTATKDEKTMLSKHPEDFDLFYLGDYDDQTGKVVALDTPHHIIKAVDCVKPESGLRSGEE